MFSKIRSLIFKLDPELAHNLAIKALKFNYIPMNNSITDFIIHHTIASSKPESESLPIVDNIIKSYQKIFSTNYHFFCNNCGYKSHVLNWLCPSCNYWNSIVPKLPIDIIEESANND